MEDRFLTKLLENQYCPEEIDSLAITFVEYNVLLSEFKNLEQSDKAKAYDISIRAIAWQDWFNAQLNSVGYIIKALDAEKNTLIASEVKNSGERSFTKAEKIANGSEAAETIRKKKAIAEAIYGLLDARIKTLEKIFYFCRGLSNGSDSPQ